MSEAVLNEDEALALYVLRSRAEERVDSRVALAMRDYFLHPDVPFDVSWPEAWKELACMNAKLGRMASIKTERSAQQKESHP